MPPVGPVRLPRAQVGDARLREEVGVHAVRPERDARAERLRVGVPDGVLEVAARVVDDPGAGLLRPPRSSARQVDAVREDRLRPEGAGLLEAREGARVAAVLGDVHVEPGCRAPREIRRGGERLVRDGEAGVEADHRGQALPDRPFALGEALARALGAVPIRRAVAERGRHARPRAPPARGRRGSPR